MDVLEQGSRDNFMRDFGKLGGGGGGQGPLAGQRRRWWAAPCINWFSLEAPGVGATNEWSSPFVEATHMYHGLSAAFRVLGAMQVRLS